MALVVLTILEYLILFSAAMLGFFTAYGVDNDELMQWVPQLVARY